MTRAKMCRETAEGAAYAVAGFVIAVGMTNVAYAQAVPFLDEIKNFIRDVVDHPIWAMIPGVYAIYQLALFAQVYEPRLALKGVGGAAAAGIWVIRWDILSRIGVQQ